MRIAIAFLLTAAAFGQPGKGQRKHSISGNAGVASATVQLSGNSTKTTTASISGTYTFSGLVDGGYTVTPSKSGYTFSPVSTSVTLSGVNISGVNSVATQVPPPPDTTPPVVSMTTPAAGATVSGPVAVSANASDNVGVAGVQFLLEGANLGTEVVTAPYAISWDSKAYSDGLHTLSARARDGAGNQGLSASVQVTVNNAAPPLHSVTLSWTASTSTNVAGYKVYRSATTGGPYGALYMQPLAATSYVDPTVSAGQTYYYVATAVDSINQESIYSNQAQAIIPSP